MQTTIEIAPYELTAEELLTLLSEQPPPDCVLQVEEAYPRVRGFEVNLVVAVVGLAGVGLGSLINGLLRVYSARVQNSYLEIKGPNWTVRLPAGASPAKVARAVETARTNGINRIDIRGPQRLSG